MATPVSSGAWVPRIGCHHVCAKAETVGCGADTFAIWSSTVGTFAIDAGHILRLTTTKMATSFMVGVERFSPHGGVHVSSAGLGDCQGLMSGLFLGGGDV